MEKGVGTGKELELYSLLVERKKKKTKKTKNGERK